MDLSVISPTSYTDLMAWFTHAINLVISLSALLAAYALIRAGIEYILSGGDAEKAEKAQKSIIFALIGMILVFIAPIVIRFVLNRLLSS